jgi:glutamine synthetase
MASSSELAQSLEGSGIRFVRVVWCDNANSIRGKAVHTKKIGPDYFKHGVGVSTALQAIPVTADVVVPQSGLTAVGDVRLVPDWSTLVNLPYAPGHARVLADMVKDGKPWAYCPRTFLKRMIAEFEKDGIEVMASFENEFYLFKPSAAGIEPVDRTNFASTLAMDISRAVIDEIAEALSNQKIPVEQYYPESGSGQHEITVRYTTALQAADRQIAFRETVRAVCLRHGLRASFLPKVFADQPGSGCHLHVSLWKDGKNLMPSSDPAVRLSPQAKAFLAGLLSHLLALMALTTPTNNSFRRIKPRTWAGAFRCWGMDNREAAIRVPTNPDGSGPTHIEFKTLDASANPYIALAGVLAAGMDGIKKNMTPPEPVNVEPADLSEDERKKRGVFPLPGNLTGALNQFSADTVLASAMGAEFAAAYLAVRFAEWQATKDLDLADEVKLLLERY